MVARTKPPTEAEVAAEYFDRVQRTGRHEQDQRARDVEWARVLERRDALVQSGATGLATAWQITKALKLGAVPLDPVTWEPAADAITDPLVTLDYWAEHRDHAVGVKLGPQRGGAMGLVAVKATTWAAWNAWVQAAAKVETVRLWSDDSTNGTLVRDLKPLGGPMTLKWQDPPGLPMRSTAVTKGDRQMREAAEQLRLLGRGKDRGGWLVWSISPGADGRLPVQNRAVLVDGVTVLGSREVVPMWAMRPEDGATLKQVDPIQQPDPNRDCPRWLLHEFGVSKWEKVS